MTGTTSQGRAHARRAALAQVRADLPVDLACKRGGGAAEASLARACLKHGLAAASLTAHTTTWNSDDGPRAAHALVALSTREGWKVPLYAIGIGDGASFVATSLPRSLPPSLPLKGVHVQLFGDVPATRRPAAKT